MISLEKIPQEKKPLDKAEDVVLNIEELDGERLVIPFFNGMDCMWNIDTDIFLNK